MAWDVGSRGVSAGTCVERGAMAKSLSMSVWLLVHDWACFRGAFSLELELMVCASQPVCVVVERRAWWPRRRRRKQGWRTSLLHLKERFVN